MLLLDLNLVIDLMKGDHEPTSYTKNKLKDAADFNYNTIPIDWLIISRFLHSKFLKS